MFLTRKRAFDGRPPSTASPVDLNGGLAAYKSPSLPPLSPIALSGASQIPLSHTFSEHLEVGHVELARDEAQTERQTWDNTLALTAIEAWSAWDDHVEAIFWRIEACNVAATEA